MLNTTPHQEESVNSIKAKLAALSAAAVTAVDITALAALPTAQATSEKHCGLSRIYMASEHSLPTISKGARGALVEYAQCLLNKQGADLVEDGVFGSATDAAVRDFQRSNGLHADGYVGPKTWNILTIDQLGARQQVLNRAQTWIDQGGVPYSQSAYHEGYRTDCSGYASMALGLDAPGLNTVGLADPSVSSKIAMADLVIDADGDNTTRHVVIFVKWTDASKTSYVAYDQSYNSNTSKQVRNYGIGEDDYDAYRPHRLIPVRAF